MLKDLRGKLKFDEKRNKSILFVALPSCACVCLCTCSIMSDSCDPMDCSPPGFSIHGISQAYWTGLQFPPPGNLADPGFKPASPVSPALQSGFLTTGLPGKSPIIGIFINC